MGPATAPCSTRNRISVDSDGASPHRNDEMTKSSTDAVNSRTCPKRRVSQPVRGSEIALATPNEVMTQVPWSGETARSPEIAGIDTFAIDVSSTFMNVASERAIVPSASAIPPRGTGAAGGARAPESDDVAMSAMGASGLERLAARRRDAFHRMGAHCIGGARMPCVRRDPRRRSARFVGRDDRPYALFGDRLLGMEDVG